MPAKPNADVIALANEQLAVYGYTVDNAGVIISPSGKSSGVSLTGKGKRFQARDHSGNLLWSGLDVGSFVEKYWYAKKQPRNPDLPSQSPRLPAHKRQLRLDTGPESFALTHPVAPSRAPRPERLLPVSEHQAAFDIDRTPRFPMASALIPPPTPGGLRTRLAGRSEVRKFHERKRDKISRLDSFTEGYIDAALWSTSDNSDPSGGEPLDKNYGAMDLSMKALDRMIADCARFQAQNAELLAPFDSAHAGHDFWLTRNRHGAGYWDGDYPEPEASQLTEAARRFGEVDLYVAGGQIHHT